MKAELAQQRHCRRTIPLDMDPSGKGVGHNRTNQALLYHRLLTSREARKNLAIRPHPPQYQLPISRI
jgi:hypothetical protein